MYHDLKHRTESEIKAYFAGARTVLYAYAVHKDGGMIVGCGMLTYRQALEILNDQEEAALQQREKDEQQDRETRQLIAQRQERE